MSIEGSPRRARDFPQIERLLPLYRKVAKVHDYRVVGLEKLPEGPALLVGYHGSPALDAILLGWLLYEREGRPPRGIAHRVLFRVPGVSGLIRALAMVPGDDDALRAAVDRGERIIVLPGGTRECFRSSRTRYALDWANRRGYARLAQRYGLPIVPFAASGVDDLYRIIGDGYRISMRLTGTDALPLCLPLGHRSLPFGPPRPVKIHQRLGDPIPPQADTDALDATVRAAVGALLREAVAAPLAPGEGVRPG